MKKLTIMLSVICVLMLSAMTVSTPKVYTATFTPEQAQATVTLLDDATKSIAESDIPTKKGIELINNIQALKKILSEQFSKQVDSVKK